MDTYKHATSIVKKLVRAGHTTYFAGGWVRDFVMGHPSEDIDIATSASPAEIMDLFPNTLLVGLAFGVVIIPIEGHQFEVATFRKDLRYIDGRHPQGIEMATPLEDALRRDFTINGMFYDPLEEVIHDYVNGQEDIKKGVIQTIGNPHERFFEDRLRMLRAFRFAARFGFAIDQETQEAVRENVDKLFPAVAMERVWQEFNKMASYPRFDQAIVDMHRLSLLEVIFPELHGIHIKDLRHLVSSYVHFPPECPTIFYLMELFPHTSLNNKIEIVKRLKAQNQNIKLIEYFNQLAHLIAQEQEGKTIDPYQWANVYANPHFDLSLQVLAARFSTEERQLLIEKHRGQFQKLKPHIERIKNAKPLVSAAHLKKLGILPGKQMGLLLKEAEKIAINEDWDEADPVLAKLMKTSLWKKE